MKPTQHRKYLVRFYVPPQAWRLKSLPVQLGWASFHWCCMICCISVRICSYHSANSGKSQGCSIALFWLHRKCNNVFAIRFDSFSHQFILAAYNNCKVRAPVQLAMIQLEVINFLYGAEVDIWRRTLWSLEDPKTILGAAVDGSLEMLRKRV